MSEPSIYGAVNAAQLEMFLEAFDYQYHFAIEDSKEGFCKVVDLISQYIGGHSVVDCGCGYGGVARQLSNAGFKVTGATNEMRQVVVATQIASNAEFLYFDLDSCTENKHLPMADTFLFLESMSHIKDPESLIAGSLARCSSLIMIEQVAHNSAWYHPLWNMHFRHRDYYVDLIKRFGWRIEECRDLMPAAAIASANLWQRRLVEFSRNGPLDFHLTLLSDLCHEILSDPERFIAEIGLMLIVARET